MLLQLLKTLIDRKMKHYLIILLLIICFDNIHAQKLNVESFVVKTNDITARTQPRQDINGNDCALIKVQLAASGAVFSGNVVGDVSYNTSEYLVYMSEGSKRLSVKLEGYLPLEASFEDYGIKALEGKTTYVMTISGASVARQIEAPKIKTGWIILESEPSGASVYINDEFVGNTPLNNYKQSYGTYQYRLESPNYHPATGTIELNAGRFEQRIALKPAFGSISVKSNVAGARILLDGKPTGKNSPATLTEIPSGSHTITLQSDKYAPQQQNVVVEDGQATDVSMSLDARFARITINSIDGAEIYSNGKLLGRGHYSEDMMEGYYDLEVRMDHYKSVTKQIQVIAGQSQDITLNPIPKYGSLDIISEPGNATIIVDGKEYGRTPFTVEHLLEGQHQFIIKLDGYANYKGTVNVIEDDNVSVTAKLSNLTSINITSNNPNATLYIDGIEQGMASGTKSVSLGQHQIQLKAKDWKDYTSIINVTSSQTSFNFIMEESTPPYRFITVEGVTFKMVRVDGGTFTMGASYRYKPLQDNYYGDEFPLHSVTLDPYYIGETEVTQELWQAVMGKNPSHSRGLKKPVEGVSWNECQDFITRLNSLTGRKFRLPTEAEWEFAARGGNKSNGYIYAGSNFLKDVAWYDCNDTHEVRTKKANELGLYDMSGNVWEWCQDWYGKYINGSQTNPTGPTWGNGRVLRGGGTSGGESSMNHRVSRRLEQAPDYVGHQPGLRLALQ